MQTLVKQIRTYLNMSQTEFAGQLNVTFQTVNRWENGRATPNKLAQSMIYELCKNKSVPVYEMTLKKIEDTSNSIKLDANRILLYHGSKSGIEGVIEPKSRKQCDFGK
ncbi:MAG: helix-turn-helix domain-containing protein, partial [Acutalibacteraceae bacterium]